MNICFYSSQLSERGTETALIDYAAANERYLSNKSFVAVPADKILDKKRYEFLASKYTFFAFDTLEELKVELERNNVEILYIITDGEGHDVADEFEGDMGGGLKIFVHCVFSTQRRHGTYYCAIHPFLNKFYHTKYPVLPHIVNPFPPVRGNLRENLGIPADAMVFGSYAGKGSFNIPFVHDVIVETAQKNSGIYFIFMNIYNFVEQKSLAPLKNIIFLPGSTDLETKARFINTSDAMIHARIDGETFGLTVAEFSIMNKPIVTYKPPLVPAAKDFARSFLEKRPGYSRAHLMNLGKTAITYKNARQLAHIFTHFSKYYDPAKNYDCFSKPFAAENVIKTFDSIVTDSRNAK